MEIERNNAKIQCSDFKKCGEIATLLSIGKPDFFLNCGFCEYTFLQLDNFIRHMYEDHQNEFPGYELKDEPSEMEEIMMEEKYNTEPEEIDDYNNTNDFILKGFEKVEIEVDMSEEHVPLDIGDNFTKEYWDEENLLENNLHGGEFQKGYNKVKLPSEKENTRNRQHTKQRKTKLLEDEYNSEESSDDFAISEKNIEVERISKVNRRRNDNRKRNISKYDKIKSEESGNDSEIPQEIENFSYFEENSHVLPKNTLELNSNQLTGNSYKSDDSDVEKELEETQVSDSGHSEDKRNESLYEAQTRTILKPTKVTIPNIILDDTQCQVLADIYKTHTCLWDENDIAYRFGNRHKEALNSILEQCNETCGLSLTNNELQSEIVRLRKIASIEKRQKILCKRKDTKYIPQCYYYQNIEYLEVDVSPFECTICETLFPGLGKLKVHVASHDGSLPFICSLCGHGFQLANNLTIHLRRHVQDYTYTCDICSKSFATSTDLKIHVRFHTGEKPYVCTICGQRRSTASHLFIHTLRHQNRRRHQCKICSKTFIEKGTLKDHMLSHSQVRNYICDVCQKGFKTKKHLYQHKLIHAAEKKYACTFCEKRFSQSAGLKGHMKTHGTKLSATAKSKPAIMKMTITTDITLKDEHYKLLAEIYKVNRCLWDEEDIAYRFRNRREEALKSVHKEFTKKSGLNLTLEDLESQIVRLRRSCSIEKRKNINCKRDKLKFIPNCPYYQQIAYLEVDVPPFECKICDKLLSGLGQYKVHVASHDGSLPFKCHLCGHGFQLASNLTVHLRRHVHDYTYNCEVCNKPCATTTELKIHMRSHTGEKPFVCYICGQKSRTSSQLLVHTLRHQNRPRHKCKLCPKTFYETGTLNEHMSIHRNIRDKICEICDKGFTSNKQLRQHQLIHNVEKKYACKFCEKRFAQYAGLSGHMKTHGTKLSASAPDNFL